MKNNVTVVLAILVAQWSPGYGLAAEAGSVLIGSFRVTPSLDAQFKYDDNILSSDANEIGSMVTVIRPAFGFQGGSGDRRLSFQYAAELGRFNQSSVDDYEDQQVRGELGLDFTEWLRSDFFAGYVDAHEPRGSSFSQGTATSLLAPDEFHVRQLGGGLSLGGIGADTGLRLDVDQQVREFDTRRTVTRDRDLTRNTASLLLHYRVSPNFFMLAQARYADIEYSTLPISSISLDSDELRMLLGIKWKITAITSGEVKVGHLRKDFADNGRENFSGSSWTASITWSPLTYSVFDIQFFRKSEETTGVADFIDTREFSLTWKHKWLERLSSTFSVGLTNEDHAPSVREDDIEKYIVHFNYQMRRWLTLGAGVEHRTRGSTQVNFSYDRNIIAFTAEATL